MADITDHIDDWGFVVSTEPDVASRGGNSIQHTSIYYIAENIKPPNIVYSGNQPLLHWNTSYWPGSQGHMSRDNLTCAICGLKLFKRKLELTKLMFKIFKRAGFLWNTKRIGDDHWNVPDFCGPMIWLVAMRFKWSPLNIVSDIYLWASIYIQLTNTARDKNRTDGHINLIIIGETCRIISDNFILNKILKWYKNTNVPQYAADDYFDREYSPPLHVHLKKIVEGW